MFPLMQEGQLSLTGERKFTKSWYKLARGIDQEHCGMVSDLIHVCLVVLILGHNTPTQTQQNVVKMRKHALFFLKEQ